MIFGRFLGLTLISVNRDSSAELLNTAAAVGIKTYNHSFSELSFTVSVPYFDAEKLRFLLSECGVVSAVEESNGFVPFIIKRKSRFGLLIGFILLLMLFSYMPKLLWSIEIIGNEKVTADSIKQALSDSGLFLGCYLPDVESDRIESGTLRRMSELSWISVNIDGSSAFVEVREYNEADRPIRGKPFANILATEDAIVTDIEVFSGFAEVKRGEMVRCGELLIGGIISKENLGTVMTYARGNVRGRVYREYEIFIPFRHEALRKTGKKTYSLSLSAFEKSYMITTPVIKYENAQSDFKFFTITDGNRTLPFSLVLTALYETDTVNAVRSEEEALFEARRVLSEKLKNDYPSGEIISSDTRYEKNKDGIKLFADVVIVCDIGRTLEFDGE